MIASRKQRPHAWFRAPRVALATACVLLPLSTWQCDNGATGVETCRRIEEARCELVRGCPGAVQTDDDVTACKLFYRDQCLFGIADAQQPDEVSVAACLAALEQARACVDANQPFASCSEAPALAADATSSEGCKALLTPQDLAACSFLHPDVANTSSAGGAGAGGDAATSGNGGAGGSGGSGGS